MEIFVANQNKPNGNSEILPYITKQFLRLHEVIFRKTAMVNVFNAFTGHLTCIKVA